MPIATTQEQQALQASLRDWAKRADPIAVVRRGPSTALLAELTALGVFAIPLDGGTVTDLAAALEQLACVLAPGPVLPTALANLLLGRSGRPDLAEATGCVRLAPGSLTGTRQADGGLRVTGETGPVLWAAGHLLAAAAIPDSAAGDSDAWFLLAAGQPGVTVDLFAPLDFSRELAAVRLDDAVIAPENLLPALSTEGIRDLAATLYAAEAAGVAAWCSGTAARLRQDPPPVRPPDRCVPGGQAPVCHHGLPGRTRRRPGLGRRPRRRRGARRASAGGRGRRGAGAGRRGGQREGLHPGAGRHRLHLGARRPPVPAPGAGAAPAARRQPRLAHPRRHLVCGRPPKRPGRRARDSRHHQRLGRPRDRPVRYR